MSGIDEPDLRRRLAGDGPVGGAGGGPGGGTVGSAMPRGYVAGVIGAAHRRRRRQRILAVAASVATVVTLVGGATWWGRGSLGANRVNTVSTPSATTVGRPAPTAPSDPNQSTPATQAPSGEPGRSSTTPPSTPLPQGTWPSTGPTAAAPRGALAAGVRLPHEGVTSTDSDTTSWTVTPWQLQLCAMDTERFPLLGRAEVVRAIERRGPELHEVEGIVVFPDAESAVRFVADLRAAAYRCPSNATPVPATLVQPLPGAWGEGFVAGISVPLNDGVSSTAVGSYGTTVVAVARVGRAVVTSWRDGEYAGGFGAQLPDWAVAAVRGPLDAMAPSLCAYTAAECR